jgi:hypothetical protein
MTIALNRLQEQYDQIQEHKAELAKLKKEREEQLILDSSDYERLGREISGKQEARKKIELDYDKAHPQLAEQIAALADKVKEEGDSLGHAILAALMKGQKVELEITVRGRKKKIVPRFKVSFENQQRMF